MGLTRIVYTTHIIGCTLEGKTASVCPPKLAAIKEKSPLLCNVCLKSKSGLICFEKSETIKTKNQMHVWASGEQGEGSYLPMGGASWK